MVKNLTTTEFKIDMDDLEFNRPESVELDSEEIKMYSLLFDDGIGKSFKVNKPLQECLKEFIEAGLLEKEYFKFVKLCHQATKNNLDSVKKDGLHVINNSSDVSLICADSKGEWEVVCTIERSTIKEFYKHKNIPLLGTRIYTRKKSSGMSGNIKSTGNTIRWDSSSGNTGGYL